MRFQVCKRQTTWFTQQEIPKSALIYSALVIISFSLWRNRIQTFYKYVTALSSCNRMFKPISWSDVLVIINYSAFPQTWIRNLATSSPCDLVFCFLLLLKCLKTADKLYRSKENVKDKLCQIQIPRDMSVIIVYMQNMPSPIKLAYSPHLTI